MCALVAKHSTATATLAELTASLKVAVTVELGEIAVAPLAGFLDVTVGGVVSGGVLAAVVNVHTSFAMVLPAVSVAPLTVTAYVVLAVSGEDGVKVRVRLAES